jgi:hypothetical protein
MKLTEAYIGTQIAGTELGITEVWGIIHRCKIGFHRSCYSTAQGQQTSHLWTFPSLSELLLFVQTQGFAEIDPDVEDWQTALR